MDLYNLGDNFGGYGDVDWGGGDASSMNSGRLFDPTSPMPTPASGATPESVALPNSGIGAADGPPPTLTRGASSYSPTGSVYGETLEQARARALGATGGGSAAAPRAAPTSTLGRMGAAMGEKVPTLSRMGAAIGDQLPSLGPVLRGAGRALGPAAVIGSEAAAAAPTFRDPNATGYDKAAAAATGVGRGSATLAGAGLGMAAGSVVPGPGTFLGGLAGAGAGYLLGDKAIDYGRRLLGVDPSTPSPSPGAPQSQVGTPWPGHTPLLSAMGPPVTGAPQGGTMRPGVGPQVPRGTPMAPVDLPPNAVPMQGVQPAPGIEGISAGIEQSFQTAKQDPEGSAHRADVLEAQTGTDIGTLFNQLMAQYGQPNLEMSRGEKANLLMQFGLATMAAASRPGAKFAGSIGEGGLSALGAANQIRGQKIEMNQKQQASAMQFLRDYTQDRRTMAMMEHQNRRDDIYRQATEAREQNYERARQLESQRLEQLSRFQAAQMGLMAQRGNYLDARADNVGAPKPMTPIQRDAEIAKIDPSAPFDPVKMEQYRRRYPLPGEQFGAQMPPPAAGGMVQNGGQLYGPAPR